MSAPSLMESLRGIQFLHDFSQQHLDAIANVARLREFDARQVVFREGDIAEQVYLVDVGNVSLEICAPSVGCKRILTIGPGEILAWSALLEHAPLTATARTVEATRLVELNAAQLFSVFEKNPRFGYEFMRRAIFALAKRLDATRMQLLDVYGSQLPAAVESRGGI